MRPELAVVEALRIVIVALAAYLLIIGFVGVLVRVLGMHPLVRAVDAITPRVVRHVIGAIVGASLASPAVALAASESQPPIVMHRLPDDAPSPNPTTTTTTTTTTTSLSPASPQPTTPPAPSPPRAVSSPPPQTTWRIQPGEHFWAVAEGIVGASLGREASPAEVVPYWIRLIEANRDRLVDPENADLVLPGQEMLLPPR